MNKFKKLLDYKFEKHQPITIIYRDERGNAYLKQGRYINFEMVEPYPDAPEEFYSLKITLMHKRVRYDWDIAPRIVQHFQELLVYDGWPDIDFESFYYVPRVSTAGYIVNHLKYPNYVNTPFLEVAKAFPDYIFFKSE